MDKKILDFLEYGEFDIGYDEENDSTEITYTLYWPTEVVGVKNGEQVTQKLRIITKNMLELIQKYWEIDQISIVTHKESNQSEGQDFFYFWLKEKGQKLNWLPAMKEVLKESSLTIKKTEECDCAISLIFFGDVPKETFDLVKTMWDIITIRVSPFPGDPSEEGFVELELKEKGDATIQNEEPPKNK